MAVYFGASVRWRCPACHTQIKHSELEDRPRPKSFYRCHICRLELVFDAHDERLTIAPVHVDEANRNIRQ